MNVFYCVYSATWQLAFITREAARSMLLWIVDSYLQNRKPNRVTKDTGVMKSIHCHRNHTTLDLSLYLTPHPYQKHMLAYEWVVSRSTSSISHSILYASWAFFRYNITGRAIIGARLAHLWKSPYANIKMVQCASYIQRASSKLYKASICKVTLTPFLTSVIYLRRLSRKKLYVV